MDYLAQGFYQAVVLLVSRDPETYSAIFTSLKATSLSIVASLVIGLPLGFLLGYFEFRGKKQLRAVFDTLLALPTVLVGLLVYILISSRGPFGNFGLLFTIPGIAVAQTVLIVPIVVALTASAIESLDARFSMTLFTLGARGPQIALTSLYEARNLVMAAAVTAYGRAVSEVGISMIIGGNILWHTRTITTAISLETGRGAFSMGIALGIVLLALVSLVNWSLIILKRNT